MDAEIRQALRAMSLPGALESIPTEAMLAIARECLAREDAPEKLAEALADVLARIEPAQSWANPPVPHHPILLRLTQEQCSRLGQAAYSTSYLKEHAERAEREAKAAADREANKLGSFTIPADPSFNWSALECRLRGVSEQSWIEMSLPEPRDLALKSLRAMLRRRAPRLRVRQNADRRGVFIFKPKEEEP